MTASHPFDLAAETLHTERLDLVPLSLALCEAILAGDRERAAALLGADLGEWPGEAERAAAFAAYVEALRADPAIAAWLGRAIVLRERRLVVGSANLKGRPTAAGRVEVGWGLIEEHRGHGYAREAVAALLARAFADRSVREVVAEIEPRNARSVQLAQALGFTPTGIASTQPERHAIWLLSRERYEARPLIRPASPP